MNSSISRNLKRILKKLRANIPSSRDYFTKASKILEVEFGHHRSVMSKESVAADGTPIPWFTYPAIDFIEQFDFSGKTMLEWGAGNSSVFFSRRVRSIFSIENNEKWFKAILEKRISNQKLFLVDESKYAQFAGTFNCQFDIILIDGIDREGCADTAVNILAEDGFIILDNSDRSPDIAAGLRMKDLIQIDFHGFGPINNYTWTTSLFLTRKVMLQPCSRQPQVPKGGGY